MADEKKKSVPYATVPEVVDMMNARANIVPDKGFITVKRSGADVRVKLSNKVISDASAMVEKLIRPHSPKVADEIKKKYEGLKVPSGKVGRSKANFLEGSEAFKRAVYAGGTIVVPSVPSVFGDVKEVYVTKHGTGANALIIIGSNEASVKGFNLKK